MDLVILLPIFRPNVDWLSDQLNSIANQTFKNFRCVVSYDGSVAEREQKIIEELLPDKRFAFLYGHQHAGTYLHVERLIREHGVGCDFFALCDQDDVWDPHKIQKQMNYFVDPSVSAVSANGWIVNQDLGSIGGKTTFNWFRIQSQVTPYSSVLNQVTGASAIFRSSCMVKCIPFPENLGSAVHDHWLYITAISNGMVEFESEPLWSYRQHEDNQIGASASQNNFFRFIKALRKIILIVKTRVHKEEDVVIRQGRQFLSEATDRWPKVDGGHDVLGSPLSLLKRVILLSPKELMISNLESLRVALTRNRFD